MNLRFSNIVFRNTFTAASAGWIANMLDLLPPDDTNPDLPISRKMWLEQAAGAVPGLGGGGSANRWAIADLFLSPHVTNKLYHEVAQKISSLNINLDLNDNNSVGPRLAAEVIVDWATNARVGALATLKRVTDLAINNIGGVAVLTADSLRKAVIADLALRHVGNQNVINVMFKNGIDAALALAFTTMVDDLAPAARLTWLQSIDATAGNVTALKYLLLRESTVAAAAVAVADVVAPVNQVKVVLDKVASIPALAPNAADFTSVWAYLNDKNFADATPNAHRALAMPVLIRIADLPGNNDLRKSLTVGLAGIGAVLPVAPPNVGTYTGVVDQNGSGLAQSLARQPITADVIRVYKALVADQPTPADQTALLNQALGAKQPALLTLTDGIAIGGGPLVVASTRLGAPIAGETQADLDALVKFFVDEQAVSALNTFDARRSRLVFNLVLPSAATPDTSILKLLDNVDLTNRSEFAAWALNSPGTRAAAFKRVLDEASDEASVAVQSEIFRRAMVRPAGNAIAPNGDMITVVRAKNPNTWDKTTALGKHNVYRKSLTLGAGDPLTNLQTLADNLAAFGLNDVVDGNDFVFAPADANNALLTFLLKVANADIPAALGGLGLSGSNQDLRKRGLVRSLALYVKQYLTTQTPGLTPAQWQAYVDPNVIAAAKLPNFQQSGAATTDAVAKDWLYVP